MVIDTKPLEGSQEAQLQAAKAVFDVLVAKFEQPDPEDPNADHSLRDLAVLNPSDEKEKSPVEKRLSTEYGYMPAEIQYVIRKLSEIRAFVDNNKNFRTKQNPNPDERAKFLKESLFFTAHAGYLDSVIARKKYIDFHAELSKDVKLPTTEAERLRKEIFEHLDMLKSDPKFPEVRIIGIRDNVEGYMKSLETKVLAPGVKDTHSYLRAILGITTQAVNSQFSVVTTPEHDIATRADEIKHEAARGLLGRDTKTIQADMDAQMAKDAVIEKLPLGVRVEGVMPADPDISFVMVPSPSRPADYAVSFPAIPRIRVANEHRLAKTPEGPIEFHTHVTKQNTVEEIRDAAYAIMEKEVGLVKLSAQPEKIDQGGDDAFARLEQQLANASMVQVPDVVGGETSSAARADENALDIDELETRLAKQLEEAVGTSAPIDRGDGALRVEDVDTEELIRRLDAIMQP
ncbi:MAG: hypothetical protein G01um10148_1054 [Parcubacteria group bacterium Gr01-1014_8]|nr:MAG: hypothetical protein G01um10148_1054 [Parcubacteria group bacterium Gr01-1014_8]